MGVNIKGGQGNANCDTIDEILIKESIDQVLKRLVDTIVGGPAGNEDDTPGSQKDLDFVAVKVMVDNYFYTNLI